MSSVADPGFELSGVGRSLSTGEGDIKALKVLTVEIYFIFVSMFLP